ncbi:uncharacterized, partial [Tachysurus ichikawai]
SLFRTRISSWEFSLDESHLWGGDRGMVVKSNFMEETMSFGDSADDSTVSEDDLPTTILSV